jgi:hypothetical protein
MNLPACLVELLQTTAIDGAVCWWLGERHPLAEDATDDQLVLRQALASRLYADFYITGGVAPPLPGHTPRAALTRPEPDLSSHNCGGGSPRSGWTILDEDDGSFVVERSGLRLRAARRYVRQPDDGPVVVVPKEVTGLPWGFYTAHGDAGGCDANDERVDRYYLNPRGDSRPAVLAVVTGHMNRRGLPFRFKVLNDSATNRCDGAVLYVDSDLRCEVRPVLAEIATSLRNGLAPRVPALTKALAPGIGFAEDPPGDVSFGTHRCALLAEALLAAESRAGNGDRRHGAIADHFDREGLSLERPHLNAASDPRDDPAPLS